MSNWNFAPEVTVNFLGFVEAAGQSEMEDTHSLSYHWPQASVRSHVIKASFLT